MSHILLSLRSRARASPRSLLCCSWAVGSCCLGPKTCTLVSSLPDYLLFLLFSSDNEASTPIAASSASAFKRNKLHFPEIEEEVLSPRPSPHNLPKEIDW